MRLGWFSLVIILAGAALARDKGLDQKRTELLRLQEILESSRDSLQYEITSRYSAKQRAVEQREADKQEFDQEKEKQERIANDLTRLKEECLAKEQNRLDEARNADLAQAEWDYLKSTLGDLLQKEADAILESFPFDRETRRLDLKAERASFAARRDPGAAWAGFFSYHLRGLAAACTLSLVRQEALLESGPAVTLSAARFGNVFGLALDPAGRAYLIRQTGKLGSQRYAIDSVAAPELASFIRTSLPAWLNAGKPGGEVLAEVLQNEQSRLLLAGKTESWAKRFGRQIRAGGMVMVPLLLLPFWALALVIMKIIQFVRFRRRAFAQIQQIVTSLAQQGKSRDQAERQTREFLAQESGALSRGINTVAVIAGAAPLLGLLGTISGMITLFAAVTHYGTGDPKFLAGGISEALITAKTGLAIAIPCLFVHDLLRQQRNRRLVELEKKTLELLHQLWPAE